MFSNVIANSSSSAIEKFLTVHSPRQRLVISMKYSVLCHIFVGIPATSSFLAWHIPGPNDSLLNLAGLKSTGLMVAQIIIFIQIILLCTSPSNREFMKFKSCSINFIPKGGWAIEKSVFSLLRLSAQFVYVLRCDNRRFFFPFCAILFFCKKTKHLPAKLAQFCIQ